MLALQAARGSGAHRGGQTQSSLSTQGEDGDGADGPTPRALQRVWVAFPETLCLPLVGRQHHPLFTKEKLRLRESKGLPWPRGQLATVLALPRVPRQHLLTAPGPESLFKEMCLGLWGPGGGGLPWGAHRAWAGLGEGIPWFCPPPSGAQSLGV